MLEVQLSFPARRRLWALVLVFLGIALAENALAAEPLAVGIAAIRQDPGRFLTNPVAVTGTVTLQARPGTFFMQDGSHSMLVLLSPARDVRPGDRVRVAGTVSADGFSPYLVRASIEVLGRTNPPAPIAITPAEASTGRYDCQLVSITGELLFPAERYGDTWVLLLKGSDHFFRADMVRSDRLPVLAHLQPKSVVRLTGVCSVGSGNGVKKVYRIIVSQPESIAVVRPAPWLSFQLALKLLGFTALLALAVFIWVITLRRKIKQQTVLIERQAREYATGLERTVQERTAGLKRAVEDMQVFSSGVSHDLRAPLRSISGLCDVLVEDHAAALPPEAADYVRRIQQSTRKLSQLTADLLEYSRVASGDVQLTPVSLHDVVTDVVSALPEQRAGHLQIDVRSPLPGVLGHPASVRQVLENLLSNAVKHARRDGELRIIVSAEKRGDFVRVSVQDNGIGIAPEYHEKIFQMFQRLNASSDGSGIGLAVVKRSVEKMGGRMGVESQVNGGSNFWFELTACGSKSE